MKKILGYIILMLGCIWAHGQAIQTDSIAWEMALEEMVITGNFQPQSVKNSVYQIKTISSERIQSQGSTRLQDVLQTELNIRFQQDMALGEATMSMQGLSGQNVKILLDGVPIVGRQGTSNAVNLNQINVHTIERIEIVEGPMSVIYGADAIAGVINIITKKPGKERWKLGLRLHEESVGNEYSLREGIHNQSIFGSYRWKKWYLQGDAAHNYFGGWQGNATGRDRQWHPKSQYQGAATIGYQNDNHHLYYRLDALDEFIENRENFNGREAIDQHYLVQRWIHQVQIENQWNSKWASTSSFAYTTFDRNTRSVVVNQETGDTRLALGAGRQDFNSFGGYTARHILSYRPRNGWHLQQGIDINLETGEGGRLMTGLQRIGDYAAFSTVEYAKGDRWSIRPGLRFIYNTAYDAPPVIPSINGRLRLHEKVQLKASYARGFRAPSIRELYFFFFDASHSISGNPDLASETSNSYNSSLQFDWLRKPELRFNTQVTAFFNQIQNMIGFGISQQDPTVTTYLNVEQFQTQGMTLNNQINVGRWDLQGGASLIGRYNRLRDRDESLEDFTWTPEINASLAYQLPTSGWSFHLFYKYTGRLPFYELRFEEGEEGVALAEIGGFHWADLSINKKINQRMDVQLGGRNLFNVVQVQNTSNTGSAHSSVGPRPVGYGRSFFASIQIQLGN